MLQMKGKIVVRGYILLFLILLFGSLAFAENIGIEDLRVKAIIGEKASVTANYLVSNNGSAQASAAVSFQGLKNNSKILIEGKPYMEGTQFLLEPREKKELRLEFTQDAKKTYYYGINILIDGYRPDYVLHTQVEYLLPWNYTLTQTNGRVAEDGAYTRISWEKNNTVPVIIPQDYQVWFSRRSFDIEFVKNIDKAELAPNSVANITLSIKNNGDDLSNLQLVDYLAGRDLCLIRPEGVTIEEDEVLERLIWNIPNLRSGELLNVSYVVEACSNYAANVSILPAELTLQDSGDKAPSNAVQVRLIGNVLGKKYCVINGTCDPDETEITCPKDCKPKEALPNYGLLVLAIIVLAILIAISYLAGRRIKEAKDEKGII